MYLGLDHPAVTTQLLGHRGSIVNVMGYTAIRRTDRRLAVTVTADVDEERVSADEVTDKLVALFPKLEQTHPGVRLEARGQRREMTRSFGSLKYGFMAAAVMIYTVLAWLFRSYVQPVIVMTAIPMGLVGVIVGHWITGYDLTFLSQIGFVALSGIVVNDSLILVDLINRRVREGVPLFEAVVSSGRRRLRPILLTTLTTVLGLAPMMLETSFQARFLIPMAVSISFGLCFATLLTLIVVPPLYLILADLRRMAARVWYGPRLAVPASTPRA